MKNKTYKLVDDATIKEVLQEADKPTCYEGKDNPLNELDDRVFEILLYQLFKKRIEKGNIKESLML